VSRALKDEVKVALVKARLSEQGIPASQLANITSQDVAQYSNYFIARILMDPLEPFQNSGLPSVMPLCDYVETLGFTQTATAQGIVSTHGIQAAFNLFVVAIGELYYDLGGNLSSVELSDLYSWDWQFCSEFGYYQVADPNNPVSIETTFLQLADRQQQCDTTFNTSYLPNTPNVAALDKYGGWNMNPSNVFFTNGELDPWRTLSVGSLESNSPRRNASGTIPARNVSPQSPSYFGLTYPAQVHGLDMYMITESYSDAEKKPFLDGMALFEQALDGWLPSFEQSSSNGVLGVLGWTAPSLSLFIVLLSFLILA